MTELQHLAADTSVIDRADPAVAAAMVTKALEESRSWLAVAMQGTDPTPIAEFKAWAATVEEATRQKKLGREIELDAAEMVRRAERGIGVAVRRGQDAGEIATRGDGGPKGDYVRSGKVVRLDAPQITDVKKKSPDEYLPAGAARVDTYAMSDASDEEFEGALAEAKADGNLTRANVVRKVRERTGGGLTRKQKAALLQDLADKGYSSRQMIGPLQFSRDDTVRELAREYGIEIPADKTIGKTRRHDSNRIAQETVNALHGLAMGVELINYDDLHVGEAAHWVTSLSESFRALNRFHKEIKEIHQ